MTDHKEQRHGNNGSHDVLGGKREGGKSYSKASLNVI